MAQQKFGNSFREALWETFEKKCFHCSRELLLVDMQVDHIVPEHLHQVGEDQRKAALAGIGLPDTFNILGNENLAPSCVRCNSTKSGSVLTGGATAIALTRIERKLPALDANQKKKREDRGLEAILLSVGRALDKGAFTPDELSRQFEKVVANWKRDRDPNIINFETGIRNSAPSLGFTQNAKRNMESRRFTTKDVFQAVLGALIEGKFKAIKVADQNDRYLIEGPDNLNVAFAIKDDTVIVLSVFGGDD
jgi:5-methylcytosine-specific restriction endonuclease McrA